VAALFVSEVGTARCYGLPYEFNDMTRSFLLYPEGSAVVGLSLYSDYNCAGLAKDIRQFYAPSVLPTFPLDALSSCTYDQMAPPPSRRRLPRRRAAPSLHSSCVRAVKFLTA
jgi:hypothetical protein